MITETHRKKYADLKIQAMMFSMDIDIETWSLVPKSNYKEAFWITRYQEKLEQSDNLANQPEENWGEDER